MCPPFELNFQQEMLEFPTFFFVYARPHLIVLAVHLSLPNNYATFGFEQGDDGISSIGFP